MEKQWTQQDYLDDLTQAYKSKQPPAPSMARALYNLERIANALEAYVAAQMPSSYPKGH